MLAMRLALKTLDCILMESAPLTDVSRASHPSATGQTHTPVDRDTHGPDKCLRYLVPDIEKPYHQIDIMCSTHLWPLRPIGWLNITASLSSRLISGTIALPVTMTSSGDRIEELNLKTSDRPPLEGIKYHHRLCELSCMGRSALEGEELML